jgi:protein O-GlcNAc transferase
MFAVPPGRATAALRQRFERHGIERRRVSFAPRMNIDDYFAAIADVDVALDTFPYGGGTTSFDVLWMGVPLVALAGERPVSRSGISILSNLQLPELIAGTDDAYVETNLRLAADAQWRRTLRETLRETMRRSPLVDADRFTRDFESGIRRMLDDVRR